jgi:hypothetical protein
MWKKRAIQQTTVEKLSLSEGDLFGKEVPELERLYTDYAKFGYDHGSTCHAAYSDWRVYGWLLRT